MRLETARYRVGIDVAHGVFLACVAAACIWYLLDARAASLSIQNLLLVEPVAILVLLLVLVVLPQTVSITRRTDVSMPPVAALRRISRVAALRVAGSMLLLGIYVVTLDRVGFDLATYCYGLASLLLLGERRPLVLCLFPLLFAGIVIYAFDALVSLPIPTVIGGLR